MSQHVRRPGAPRTRARAMSAEDRRRAIVAALVPLLLDRPGDLTTREIAEAAGVAEGTIFRVFDDKRALMLAVAREAIDPADARQSFDDALAACTSLEEKIEVAVHRVQDRMRRTMSVLVSLGRALAETPSAETPSAETPSAEAAGARRGAPPAFLRESQERLHRTLTEIFEPHRSELRVTPETAAITLRGLIVGCAMRELGSVAALTPGQITDIVLHGVRAGAQ